MDYSTLLLNAIQPIENIWDYQHTHTRTPIMDGFIGQTLKEKTDAHLVEYIF